MRADAVQGGRAGVHRNQVPEVQGAGDVACAESGDGRGVRTGRGSDQDARTEPITTHIPERLERREPTKERPQSVML